MIIITSIAPGHSNFDNQHDAINSWQNFGRVISMNNANEIEQLKTQYSNLSFIETKKTLHQIIKKPLVNINAMIDLAIGFNEDLLITNSDIIIESLPEFKRDGVSIISRYDYTNTFDDGRIFNNGFDVVFIPKELLIIFPPSIYSMGCAWWDYWIPYRAMQSAVNVYWPQGRFAFHKLHATHYSQDEWNYIGEYFKWEFRLPKPLNIGMVATNILANIKAKAIQ